MSGIQQFAGLMCILITVLIVTFLIMAPSIINAKQHKEP